MLFLDHDFFTNFEGINKSKDKPLMKDLIFSEIAKVIALHKNELIKNIKESGYNLPDTNDTTVIDFLFKRASVDTKVSDILANMIKKYNVEQISNSEGENEDNSENWGGIISGLGNTIGGIFAFAASAKQAKANVEMSKQQTEQAKLLAQVEAIKAANKKGLSKGAIIGIVSGGIILLSVILYLALKKTKVQVVTE